MTTTTFCNKETLKLKYPIQGKALTELGANKPTTHKELTTLLSGKCRLKESLETIQTILDTLKPGSKNLRVHTNVV